MRILRDILKEIASVFDRANDEITNKYGTIFKGGVALLGVFLLGISQAFPILLEHEFEARKLQYKVEASSDKSINDIECIEANDKETCKLAKYKIKAVESTAKLAFNLVFLCFYLGVTLIFISVIGFVSSGQARST